MMTSITTLKNKAKLAMAKRGFNIATKRSGMDGLLVGVALLLLALILVFAFREKLIPVIQEAIGNAGKELKSISDWSN